MLGYTDARHNDEAFDADGYFRTGDLGYRSHGDFLTVSGRKKDLIIRGGENMSPKEIEDALHRHPAIQEVACVAMPHERLGETVCAFVIPQPGCSVDVADAGRPPGAGRSGAAEVSRAGGAGRRPAAHGLGQGAEEPAARAHRAECSSARRKAPGTRTSNHGGHGGHGGTRAEAGKPRVAYARGRSRVLLAIRVSSVSTVSSVVQIFGSGLLRRKKTHALRRSVADAALRE